MGIYQLAPTFPPQIPAGEHSHSLAVACIATSISLHATLLNPDSGTQAPSVFGAHIGQNAFGLDLSSHLNYPVVSSSLSSYSLVQAAKPPVKSLHSFLS